jgi:hypothetical protein
VKNEWLSHWLSIRLQGRLTPLCFAFLLMKVVSRIFASWNQLDGWLRQVEELRRVA